MAEQQMIDAVQAALDHHGFDDKIMQVGQFEPRGTVGSRFAGGMAGGTVGDAFGSAGNIIGEVAGELGGTAANTAASGLPREMLIGASETTVYGFKMVAGGRRHEPHDLVFGGAPFRTRGQPASDHPLARPHALSRRRGRRLIPIRALRASAWDLRP